MYSAFLFALRLLIPGIVLAYVFAILASSCMPVADTTGEAQAIPRWEFWLIHASVPSAIWWQWTGGLQPITISDRVPIYRGCDLDFGLPDAWKIHCTHGSRIMSAIEIRTNWYFHFDWTVSTFYHCLFLRIAFWYTSSRMDFHFRNRHRSCHLANMCGPIDWEFAGRKS